MVCYADLVASYSEQSEQQHAANDYGPRGTLLFLQAVMGGVRD